MSENNNSWVRVVISATVGVVVGLFVLHPAAMFIKDFHGFKPVFNWNAVQIAFSFEHIPMSLYFAFLGAFIGLLYGVLNERLMQTKKRLKLFEEILPICMFCKKIKDDEGRWSGVEEYITEHSTAHVAAGRICEDCAKKKNFPMT